MLLRVIVTTEKLAACVSVTAMPSHSSLRLSLGERDLCEFPWFQLYFRRILPMQSGEAHHHANWLFYLFTRRVVTSSNNVKQVFPIEKALAVENLQAFPTFAFRRYVDKLS